MSHGVGKFKQADRVLVRTDDRPGHIWTPFYVHGKIGWVGFLHGEFLNPESLGHGGNGFPKKTLYLAGFNQADVWSATSLRTATSSSST